MEELWKVVSVRNVRHSDGSWKYEVSNLGQVRISANLDMDGVEHKPRVLKQYVDGRGFCSVGLFGEDGKQKRFYVHQLVATEFVDNPDGLPKVEHIDGNNSNNRFDNLRWGLGSRAKVERQSVKPFKRGPSKERKPVRQYTKDGKFIAEYPSTVEAAKAVYISSGGQISQCCNRRPNHNTCAGFIWRYVGDDEFATEE